MQTLGENLIDWLEAYGVDTVFGIPGVHTVELYRGLAASAIRHVTPRHEQGAGFMADGYARATGRPAAAFVITGPGLTNILTPMAQAYADSIPMLVVSSVNRLSVAAMGGDLHEISNQGVIAAQATAFSHTITDPAQLPEVLARAWAVFLGARPRPVHIQIPVDLLSAPAAGGPVRPAPTAFPVPGVATLGLDRAARLLNRADRPVVLAGGGSIGSDVRFLAQDLDAPAVMTANARGVLSAGHPLAVPASPSLAAIRQLVAGSDVVLAIGTEIGQTDYDVDNRGDFGIPGLLIRIDIDPQQIVHGRIPDVALPGDARQVTRHLREAVEKGRNRAGADRAQMARAAALDEIGPGYRRIVDVLDTIRRTLVEVPIVCDSTQAAYAGNHFFNPDRMRCWFNAATGYGALGYGLPAAIGAAQGLRQRRRDDPDLPDEPEPVVCIAGDGGLQFSLADLGTAVEEGLPVILLVWNNKGYGEIKRYMQARQITPVGVDLHTPDFVAIGRAYGVHALRLEALDDLPEHLRTAASRAGPTLIEIDEALVLHKGEGT